MCDLFATFFPCQCGSSEHNDANNTVVTHFGWQVMRSFMAPAMVTVSILSLLETGQ